MRGRYLPVVVPLLAPDARPLVEPVALPEVPPLDPELPPLLVPLPPLAVPDEDEDADEVGNSPFCQQ